MEVKGKISPARGLKGRQVNTSCRQAGRAHPQHSSFTHRVLISHSPAWPPHVTSDHGIPSLKTWHPLCLVWRGEGQAPGVSLPPRHRLQPQEDTTSPILSKDGGPEQA